MGFRKTVVLGLLAIVNASDSSELSSSSAEVDVHRRLACAASGEWGVVPPDEGKTSASFGDAANTLNLQYTVDSRSYRVDLYNVCNINDATRVAIPETVLKVSHTDTEVEGCKDVSVDLEIMVGGLDGSTIYTDDVENNQGVINFCVEMILLTEDDLFSASGGVNNSPLTEGKTEVTFNHLNMKLTVDYEKDFEITGVDITWDEEKVVDTQEEVSYEVTQCQCTADGTCCTDETCPAMTQSELLYLCLKVTATDVVISTVKEMYLDQGDPNVDGLRLPAITGPTESERNALTTLSELNKQDIIVTTKLVSAFFQDITKPVKAFGVIVLDFQTSARRRMLKFSGQMGRGLQGGGGDQEFVIEDIALAASDLPDVDYVIGSAAIKISSSFILLLGLALKEVW